MTREQSFIGRKQMKGQSRRGREAAGPTCCKAAVRKDCCSKAARRRRARAMEAAGPAEVSSKPCPCRRRSCSSGAGVLWFSRRKLER